MSDLSTQIKGLEGGYMCYSYDEITRQKVKLEETGLYEGLNKVRKNSPEYPGGTPRAASGITSSEKNSANITYPTPAFNLSTIIGKRVLSTCTQLMRRSLIISEYTRKKNYDFLLQLYQNNDLMKMYNTIQLVQEFIALESDYYQLYDQVDLLPIYEAFQEHIVTRFSNIQANSDSPGENYTKVQATESDVVLLNLYVTLQSKICTLQDAAKSTLITDMNGFLNVFMENVNLLKENNAYQVIMQTGEQYSKEIDAKIEESHLIINKSFLPEIKNVTEKTEQYVKFLIVEIDKKLKELKKQQKELEDQKEKIKRSQTAGIFSGVLKFIGAIGSLIPKVGPLISIGCDMASSAVDLFKEDTSYQNIVDNGDLINDAKKGSEKMPQLEKYSREANKTLDELFGTGVRKARADDSGGTTENNDASLDGLKNAMQGAGGAIKEVGGLSSGIDNYYKEIDKVDNYLKQNEEAQKLLKDTRENVEKVLQPSINTFRNMVLNVITNAKGKSFAALSTAQRKINNFVEELMDILQILSKEFPSGGKMIKSLKNIISGVQLVIDINKELLRYIENKKMGKLMADLQSARYKNVKINDPEAEKALNKLKILLNTNIILTDYKQVTEQLKQSVFPLARAFMGKMNMKEFLKKINKKPEDILDFAINEINLFKTQLSRSNSFIMMYDEIRYRTRFDVNTPVKSFFTWKFNKNYPKPIHELLAGKEVFFRATPDFHFNKNAVKFNNISLALTVNRDQPRLNKILEDFKVIMVHTGENNYLCNKKSYVINTYQVTFQHSFRNSYYYKKPLFRNAVYDKLLGENYELSPFTLWKFQLVNISTTVGYRQLDRFKNQVSVHLIGDGEYYPRNSQVCGKNLDEYYQPLIQSGTKKKKPCVYGVPYVEDHIPTL